MKVKKYSGEFIEFDIDKLRNSLCKSGASEDEVDAVLEGITPKVYDGISTRELYKIAFKQLKEVANALAARYSLKKALRDLGPAGYYFEKWVSKFIKSYGFNVLHSQVIQGHAVTHEADVIAQKDAEMYWMECKFRNTVDAKISVTTPMYLLSRIKDISDKDFYLFGEKRKFTKGWLVTNAYLTSDSIAFGEYYKLKLLSWDYPLNKSIKSLVDQKALYPITCLTTLNAKEKDYLMQNDYMLVKELIENADILNALFMDVRRKERILKEVEELCLPNI